MAMHIVLGDGEMTRKALTETLKDLWESVEGQPFWFIVQGKSEPTDTDKNLVAWMHTNEVYYEVLTDDEESMSDIYTGSQNTHTAKRLSQKVVNLIKSSPEDGEDAIVLALFTDVNDPDAESDRWLNNTIEAVLGGEAPVKVLALNDGLVEIEFGAEEKEEAKEEAEDEPAKPSKSASKTPAKKSGPPGRPLNVKPKAPEHTREELEDMDLAALKAIAAEKGIDLPARTRMSTYIAHILGEAGEAPAAEVEEPTVTKVVDPEEARSNGFGDIDVEELVSLVIDGVITKLVSALKR